MLPRGGELAKTITGLLRLPSCLRRIALARGHTTHDHLHCIAGKFSALVAQDFSLALIQVRLQITAGPNKPRHRVRGGGQAQSLTGYRTRLAPGALSSPPLRALLPFASYFLLAGDDARKSRWPTTSYWPRNPSTNSLHIPGHIANLIACSRRHRQVAGHAVATTSAGVASRRRIAKDCL
jgi:hypothetical protein